MGRHALNDALTEEQEQKYLEETPKIIFKVVARFYQHFRSEEIGILPLHQRMRCGHVAILELDFVLDVEMKACGALGRIAGYSVLEQIIEEGFENVDPEIQVILGKAWDEAQLLQEYKPVLTNRARTDAGILKECWVHFSASDEAVEAQIAAMLKEVDASELAPQEAPEEEPKVDYFGGE